MNEAGVQDAVANEVNERLARATADLQEKYARGKGGVEESVTAPTGTAYKEQAANESKERAAQKQKNAAQKQKNQVTAADMDVEEDEVEDEEDYELKRIKEARLKQIKGAHQQKMENISKGHGQFREILQDEFIAEVTSSPVVICSFFHKDFQKCEIMNHHLLKLSQRHIESKFIKINAEKAPFFVEKLIIRTMPTVVIFTDGVATEKILGFEGLADAMPVGQEDSWPTIVLARLLAAKGGINSKVIVDDDDVELQMQARLMEMRRQAAYIGMGDADDLDDDLDDL